MRILSVILFLVLFLLSAIFLIAHKYDYADRIALSGFIIIIIGWLYPHFVNFPKNIKNLFKAIINLPQRFILASILALFVVLMFLHFSEKSGFFIEPRKVYGGDEEHYLLMINSLVKDYDLELKNNYENARRGGLDAGFLWRKRIVDHHSLYVHKKTGEVISFYAVVDVGHYVNQWRVINWRIYKTLDEYYERPHHPPGMSFIFSLFLFPFAGSQSMESAALLLLILFSLACLYFIGRILRDIPDSINAHVNLTLFLIVLGTPVLFYSLHLFKEMFLAFLVTSMCWYYFYRNKGFISGLLVVIGLFTRYSFPIIIIPLLLYSICRREWKKMVIFIGVVVGGLIGLLSYNHYMFSNIFTLSQFVEIKQWLSSVEPFRYFSLFTALILSVLVVVLIVRTKSLRVKIIGYIGNYGLVIGIVFIAAAVIFLQSMRWFFVDPKNGILAFSPFLVFIFLKLFDKKIWADYRIAGILSVACLYAVVYMIKGYGVGSAYANRQIVPVLPLFAIPLYYWIKDNKSKLLLTVFAIMAIYSVVINVFAVLAREYFWHFPVNECLQKLINDIYLKYFIVGEY